MIQLHQPYFASHHDLVERGFTDSRYTRITDCVKRNRGSCPTNPSKIRKLKDKGRQIRRRLGANPAATGFNAESRN